MNPSFLQERAPALQLPLSTSISVCLSGMITMVPRCFRDKYENTALNSKCMQSVKVNSHRGKLVGGWDFTCSMQVWTRWHQQCRRFTQRPGTSVISSKWALIAIMASLETEILLEVGHTAQSPWILKVNWTKGYFVDQDVHRGCRRSRWLLFH